jgi:hypothetical protein
MAVGWQDETPEIALAIPTRADQADATGFLGEVFLRN